MTPLAYPAIIGTCHCGAVSLEIDALPQWLTECNCSICSRYGALWAHGTRRTVRASGPRNALRAYLWGDRSIEFYHCGTCGCVTHYESVEKSADSRISVNARMLPRQAVSALRTRRFDGAVSWGYLDD
jgi:hypothetical protein